MKHTIFSVSSVFAAFGSCALLAAEPSDRFYDDFSSGSLDSAKWYAANKNWGGKVEKGSTEDYNGGVVPLNLYVKNGNLYCEAHGNLYEGDVLGICKKPAVPREDGKRVGACAVTRDYYASGRYEIRAKVAPVPGVCCTMWTFEYEELYPGDPGFEGSGDYFVVNHEIDIEMPGRPGASHTGMSYEYALCNTWVGENEGEYTTSYTKLPKAQDDGQFHTYRFDWHTGGKDHGTNIQARVEFYFDGELVKINTTHIPTKAGRLWVGAWFPNGWAGVPNFDTSIFEVDYVSITPFHEPNDQPQAETYGTDGLTDPLNIVPALDWEVGSPVASDVKARRNAQGELVFSGNGTVTNFAAAADAPWAEEASGITAIVVSDPTVSFGPRSLVGLDNLATLNGAPLELFNQVLGNIRAPDITAFQVDPTTQSANLSFTVKQSSDLIHWAPVETPLQLGSDGHSVRVSVPADSKIGFFKLVIE